MSIIYPIQYKDQFGTEATTVIDDGRVIQLTLRGVEFSGRYFSLSAVSEISSVSTKQFIFLNNELCAYSLDFRLPVVVISKGRELETKLHTQIECSEPGESKWIDSSIVLLEIEFEQNIYKTSNSYGDFEKPLIGLSKQFPPEAYLKICLNCKLSEYPPDIVRSSELRCFKNARNEFEQVKNNKGTFINLWSEKGINVDETYVCPEFEKRPPFIWR